MDKLRYEATNDDLWLSINNMDKYIGGLATLRTMLHRFQDEMETCSKATCLNSMEASVYFQQDNIQKSHHSTKLSIIT